MHHDIQLFAEYAVTPFVGVWIETFVTVIMEYHRFVTPFVGVWIETFSSPKMMQPSSVTPFVGVWIETSIIGR